MSRIRRRTPILGVKLSHQDLIPMTVLAYFFNKTRVCFNYAYFIFIMSLKLKIHLFIFIYKVIFLLNTTNLGTAIVFLLLIHRTLRCRSYQKISHKI